MKKRRTKPSLRTRRINRTGAPWRDPVYIKRDSLAGWVVNAFEFEDVVPPPDWYDTGVMVLRTMICHCCVDGWFRTAEDEAAFLSRWPELVETISRQRDNHFSRYPKQKDVDDGSGSV